MVRRSAHNLARYFGMGSEEPDAATTPAGALRSLAVIALILVLGYAVAGALGTHSFVLQLLEVAAIAALVGVAIRGYESARARSKGPPH